MHIRLEKVAKHYGRAWALEGVSATFEPGQIISILGANGAGKTTLLCTMAGIVAPSFGKVLYDGQPFHRGKLALRQRLMFLPDQPMMFARMSILQHIAMCIHLYKAPEPNPERVVEILRHLDILSLATTPAGALSRGQVYKASLAALFVVDPELWILDEPFASGMDPNGIICFKKEAAEAAKRGRIVFYTTQILEIAERFSDRICVLENGEIRMNGNAEQLKAAAGRESLEDLFMALRDPERRR
jgi:ABC-type multidrug transport system ATPase subunit